MVQYGDCFPLYIRARARLEKSRRSATTTHTTHLMHGCTNLTANPGARTRHLIAVCRGEHPEARNVRIGERFWITVDMREIKRRLALVMLSIVTTTNVLIPQGALAQIPSETSAA